MKVGVHSFECFSMNGFEIEKFFFYSEKSFALEKLRIRIEDQVLRGTILERSFVGIPTKGEGNFFLAKCRFYDIEKSAEFFRLPPLHPKLRAGRATFTNASSYFRQVLLEILRTKRKRDGSS
ncbi:hypothetical protein DLM75_17315 [Leptospira stimsonii]|uniref:Uncharacterized protein n=1 Tax=Leptospira stimsonii TaxID=2202203 RepID=A0A396Z0U2_9LEPT|nr:hypothetical protein DLM75_17315 [Leptospira stimsonii]